MELMRGAQLPDGHSIVAIIPDATRDRTWVVVGEQLGSYATWLAGFSRAGSI
jgi:hypothetical protein